MAKNKKATDSEDLIDLHTDFGSFLDKIEDLVKMYHQVDDDYTRQGILLIMSDLIELKRIKLEVPATA